VQGAAPFWRSNEARARRRGRYRTPALTEIDQVGIRPDASCALGPQAPAGMPVSAGAASTVAASLVDDACMAVAEALIESRLPGGAAAAPALVLSQK